MTAPIEFRSKSGRFLTKAEFSKRGNVSASRQNEHITSFPTESCRRIADLNLLASELWCKTCDVPLSLLHRSEEITSGLNSTFKVPCKSCQNVYLVQTSRIHVSTAAVVDKGRHKYDINFKLALGMIDAGIGNMQVNSLLSAMNIPVITDSILKRHERKVGPAIEKIAKKSCLDMAKIERDLAVTYPIREFKTIEDRRYVDKVIETQRLRANVIVGPQPPTEQCLIHRPSVISISKKRVVVSQPVLVQSSILRPSVITDNIISKNSIAESRLPEPNVVDSQPVLVHNQISRCSVITVSQDSIAECELPGPSSNALLLRPPFTPVAVTYDAGWQMRGNGKSYNSQSGHGAIMGFHTHKVLDFTTRCKICRKCNAGNTQDNHDCRLNFKGSAKAMEPDMAVQLVSESGILKEAGVCVEVLVGDDDSSTMAALRRNGTLVQKWSDINHCTKALNNALYKINHTHKILTTNVINYLKRCFTYAIQQNKNQPAKLKEALLNIVDHIFGNHENCKSWCKFLANPGSQYSALPKGECLKGDALQSALRKIFERFSDNAEKIAPCASTQPNEALNSAIAAKNPKSKFYSSSESNDYRVAAAVSQVNIGGEYVVATNNELGLSPGSNTLSYHHKMDLKRKYTRDRQRTIATKRRRLFLKSKKKNSSARNEAREGLSYQSGMGMLPIPISEPEPEPELLIPIATDDECVYVYFDLETSGLSPLASEVVQIAALSNEQIYSCYILPKKIPEKVTDVTGLHLRAGNLYLHNQKLLVTSKTEAWKGLLEFLDTFEKPVILVGHNISFDIRFTLKELLDVNMYNEFLKIVHSTVDTLKVLKTELPGRVSYKQTDIANDLCAADQLSQAHNAVGDVLTLRNIILRLFFENRLYQHCQSLLGQIQKKKKCDQTKLLASTLTIFKGHISTIIIGKIASANLTLADIKKVFEQGGEDSLYILFSENCSGHPRVTRSKKIVHAVAQALQE